MKKSLNSRHKFSKSNVFSKTDLQFLTQQDKAFAQNQFQKIYSQNMAKISLELFHQKKIKQNLNNINADQQKITKQQQQHLTDKLLHSHKQRQQNIDKRIKANKQNDERWKYKMSQIHKKLKNKTQQDAKLANKYREQSQRYWQDKKNKKQIQRSRLIQNTNNSVQIQKMILNPSLKFEKIQKNKSQYQQKQQQSRVDIQIKNHKNKFQLLNIQREEEILQKAIKKLNKIQKTREKGKKQSKISQPTIAWKSSQKTIQKFEKDQNSKILNTKSKYTDQQIPQNIYRQKSTKLKYINQQIPQNISRQKKSLNDLIQIHNEAKQLKQRKQFQQRTKILQNSFKRSKQNKIAKIIKDKVNNIKVVMIRQHSEV